VRARLTVVAKSLRSTISPLQGITATLIPLGTGAGPLFAYHARRPRGLCQQGAGVVASTSRLASW
jgi:hypothetical protein